MPTKFKRYRCNLCESLKVQWKLISLPSNKGVKRTLCCWKCAKLIYDKLEKLPLEKEPNLKWVMAHKGAKVSSIVVEVKDPYKLLR